MTMNKKSIVCKKTVVVFNKLFVPDCPRCKSSDHVKVIKTGENVIMNGMDFFNNIAYGKSPMATKNAKSRSYECSICHTIWCDEGGMIVVK